MYSSTEFYSTLSYCLMERCRSCRAVLYRPLSSGSFLFWWSVLAGGTAYVNGIFCWPPRRTLWTICKHLCDVYPFYSAHLRALSMSRYVFVYQSPFLYKFKEPRNRFRQAGNHSWAPYKYGLCVSNSKMVAKFWHKYYGGLFLLPRIVGHHRKGRNQISSKDV
jgi:hypothetical protein